MILLNVEAFSEYTTLEESTDSLKVGNCPKIT